MVKREAHTNLRGLSREGVLVALRLAISRNDRKALIVAKEILIRH